jgi:hypothetical protein
LRPTSICPTLQVPDEPPTSIVIVVPKTGSALAVSDGTPSVPAKPAP